MKCGGVFGYTDAGKTTLVQKLAGKEINKYVQEIKKGITLKVGYLSYKSSLDQEEEIYFLDNPGHAALSIEALRNMDLIDFALYILDSSSIKDSKRKELVLQHYVVYSTIFTHFKIPFGVILNKADLCSTEELLELYTKIK